MITKEVLAARMSKEYPTSVVEVDTSRSIGELSFDSLDYLIDTLLSMGVVASDWFVLVDPTNPEDYAFVGTKCNYDLFEWLEQNLVDDYELYRMGRRLCVDLHSYNKKKQRHIKHYEILRLTPRGIQLFEENNTRHEYSDSDLAFLLYKAHSFAESPFSS